jgi:hypothetical protein
MRFRKLRIAWSVGWGLAAVLLIALWVRGAYYYDFFYHDLANKRGIVVESARGKITAEYIGDPVVFDSGYGTEPAHIGGLRLTGNLSDDTHAGFRFSTFSIYTGSQNAVVCVVPLWFLSLLTGIVAATPWINWSKRFSLRTLLIATTLVAVVLGLIVYVVR